MIKEENRTTSKFRNLYGSGAVRKTEMYEGLRVSQHQTESCPISVNPKWMAVSIQSEGGGTFITLPIYQKGRIDDQRLPHFNGHSKPVVELAWNPFDDDVIATGSEDATINIWNVNNPHVDVHHYAEVKRSLLLSLQRHDKRINCLAWHPSTSNILATASSDARAIVWNVETGQAVKTIVDFQDAVWDVAWNYTGNLLASTCKDKILRIIDPRKGGVVKEARSHQGVKSSRVFFVDKDPYGGEQHYLITTGFSKMSERQIAVWDQRKLREPLSLDMIDSSPGALFPFFDQETGILYVGGKGDGSIKFYEFRASSLPPTYTTHFTTHSGQSGSSEYYSDSEEHRKGRFDRGRSQRSPSQQIDQHHLLSYLSSFQTAIPQTGLCSMPKRGLDTSICEVYRFYKLRAVATAANNVTIIEPISMIVPRKSSVYQEDLYPPTASPRPALQAAEWISGKNSAPLLVSLKNFAGSYTEEPPPKPGQKPLSQLGVLKSKFLLRPSSGEYVEGDEEEKPADPSLRKQQDNQQKQHADSPENKKPPTGRRPLRSKLLQRHPSSASKGSCYEDDYDRKGEKSQRPDDTNDKTSRPSYQKTERKREKNFHEGRHSSESSLSSGGDDAESDASSQDYEEAPESAPETPYEDRRNFFGDEDQPNERRFSGDSLDKRKPHDSRNSQADAYDQIQRDMRELREKKLRAYRTAREMKEEFGPDTAAISVEAPKPRSREESLTAIYKGKLTHGDPEQALVGTVKKRIAQVAPTPQAQQPYQQFTTTPMQTSYAASAGDEDKPPFFMPVKTSSPSKSGPHKSSDEHALFTKKCGSDGMSSSTNVQKVSVSNIYDNENSASISRDNKGGHHPSLARPEELSTPSLTESITDEGGSSHSPTPSNAQEPPPISPAAAKYVRVPTPTDETLATANSRNTTTATFKLSDFTTQGRPHPPRDSVSSFTSSTDGKQLKMTKVQKVAALLSPPPSAGTTSPSSFSGAEEHHATRRLPDAPGGQRKVAEVPLPFPAKLKIEEETRWGGTADDDNSRRRRAREGGKGNGGKRSLDAYGGHRMDQDEPYYSDYKEYISPTRLDAAKIGAKVPGSLRRQNSFTRNDNYRAFFDAAGSRSAANALPSESSASAHLPAGALHERQHRRRADGPDLFSRKDRLSLDVQPSTGRGRETSPHRYYEQPQLPSRSNVPPVPPIRQYTYSSTGIAPPSTGQTSPNASPTKVGYAAVPPIIVNSSSPAYPKKNLVTTLLSGPSGQQDNQASVQASVSHYEVLHPTSPGPHRRTSNSVSASSRRPSPYIEETTALCNQLREENRGYRTEIGFKNRRIIELENEVAEKNRKIKVLQKELGFDTYRQPNKNKYFDERPTPGTRSSFTNNNEYGIMHQPKQRSDSGSHGEPGRYNNQFGTFTKSTGPFHATSSQYPNNGPPIGTSSQGAGYSDSRPYSTYQANSMQGRFFTPGTGGGVPPHPHGQVASAQKSYFSGGGHNFLGPRSSLTNFPNNNTHARPTSPYNNPGPPFRNNPSNQLTQQQLSYPIHSQSSAQHPPGTVSSTDDQGHHLEKPKYVLSPLRSRTHTQIK